MTGLYLMLFMMLFASPFIVKMALDQTKHDPDEHKKDKKH